MGARNAGEVPADTPPTDAVPADTVPVDVPPIDWDRLDVSVRDPRDDRPRLYRSVWVPVSVLLCLCTIPVAAIPFGLGLGWSFLATSRIDVVSVVYLLILTFVCSLVYTVAAGFCVSGTIILDCLDDEEVVFKVVVAVYLVAVAAGPFAGHLFGLDELGRRLSDELVRSERPPPSP